MIEAGRGGDQPVRPGSEYGERPAGAPPAPAAGEDRPPSPGATGDPDALNVRADDVLAALARGEDMGAAQIAREVGLEATQVSSLLTRLEHDGLATRTAGGNWRITPAAATKGEPAPSPGEPRQDR